MIYLDNNATTRVDPAVFDAMLPWLSERFGNPSSMHRFGQESRQAVEHARHQVAKFVDCQPREVIFTSGGTEADNAAILGLLDAHPARRTVITSTVEHSAVREPIKRLAERGFNVIEIGVDAAGALEMDQLAAALKQSSDIALLSVMWANNETGVVFDIAAVGHLARQHGVAFHVDAVQAAGKFPIPLASLPIDLLSISAHKFHGPKGAGALVVRRNTRWRPFVRGGPQERERRGGTENVAGIVGLGIAAERAAQTLADGQANATIRQLRDELETGILKEISNTAVNGRGNRVGNTTNISFVALEAEAILLLLSEHDICASAGAACASGSLEPSHVIRAMHVPDRAAHGAVRFSLSKYTTREEIQRTIAELRPIVARLRQVLPVG